MSKPDPTGQTTTTGQFFLLLEQLGTFLHSIRRLWPIQISTPTFLFHDLINRAKTKLTHAIRHIRYLVRQNGSSECLHTQIINNVTTADHHT